MVFVQVGGARGSSGFGGSTIPEVGMGVGVGGIDEQQGTESAYVPVVIPARFDGATSVRFHRKF